MVQVQIGSETVPIPRDLVQLVLEAARRAEAMGLVAPGRPRLDSVALRQLALAIRSAGIATDAAERLAHGAAPSQHELAKLLETVVVALEASPTPAHEWKAIARVFPADDLAQLLGASPSSLKRYQSGERQTPDLVAARLHFLALVVGDLAGTYNETGIRRWFQRKRTQLDGRAPAALLRRGWDPDDEGPKRVRALARSLVSLSAT